MLGPPSSGKTALMEHVMQQSLPDGLPMYHHLNINLRGMDVTSEASFLQSFVRKGIMSNMADYFKGLKFSAHGVTLGLPGDKISANGATVELPSIQKPASLSKIIGVPGGTVEAILPDAWQPAICARYR